MQSQQTPFRPLVSRRRAVSTIGSLLTAGLLSVSAGVTGAAAAGTPPPPAVAQNSPNQPAQLPSLHEVFGQHPLRPARWQPAAARLRGPNTRRRAHPPLTAGFLGQWRGIAGPGFTANAGLMRFVSAQAAQLRLSDSQYKTIQSAYQSLRADLKPLAQQLAQARQDLAKLWNAQPLDEGQILAASQKITQLQIDIHQRIETTAEAVIATFTPEQQKQWQAWQKTQAQANARHQQFMTRLRDPEQQAAPKPSQDAKPSTDSATTSTTTPPTPQA